jgi:hypothetical protein
VVDVLIGRNSAGTATFGGVFCHNCGHRNPEGVNYCSSCGTSLTTVSPDTSVSVAPVDVGETPPAPPLGQVELPRGVGLLVIQRGNDEGVRVTLDHDVVTVGRNVDCDVFLDDVTVSRQHAEFVSDGAVTSVRDVGSLNGTFVNRSRIEAVELASGDVIQVGKFKLIYLRGGAE